MFGGGDGLKKSPKIVLLCEALEKCSRMEKRRKAKKLQRQFAQASKEKLISLVRGNGVFHDKEYLNLLKDVCDSCSVYLRFRRSLL